VLKVALKSKVPHSTEKWYQAKWRRYWHMILVQFLLIFMHF